MEKLKNWLKHRFSTDDTPAPPDFRKTASYHPTPSPRAAAKKPNKLPIELETSVSGKIDDVGPGKNVLIRNKYVREDTGTHETLKILDDSIVDSGEETGIDPYNTGGFDRSRNWNNRFRK